MNEIWILGATGRTGRAVADRLAADGATPVLVGRDPARLRALAETLPGTAQVVPAGSVDEAAALARDAAPAVVVNTIGPFTRTAPTVVAAGTHYVDLANDLPAVTALLDRHDAAVAAGRCLVTGGGFGVVGTESALRRLCADRPTPARVRVDAVPMVHSDPGPIGPTLAATIVDGFTAGGRRYEKGRLVRTRLGSDPARLLLPDGSTVGTTGMPSGELVAAHRASGAPEVVSASSMVPSGTASRAILPMVAALLSRPVIARAARGALARARGSGRPPARRYTWARARAWWPDGSSREVWLRAGEAMAFTAAITATVAARLAAGEGRPGAYTPGALFGPELAIAAGGEFLLGADGAVADPARDASPTS
ncbi:saccharopine dehydrogenase NADP-binding domain-containing protein [Actinocatenispora comari]|uniref:Membrane protein n=1 Tax=Actinocatenispora comari TaxID=2807577 RepID=A0A8J4EK78_9ACTN|nr:saccharopine dehydrogenase NADP-binding domain-containing protein [Actinocatenispora comari]GIL26800.1 membrane protein [Actinocatenispora comari]